MRDSSIHSSESQPGTGRSASRSLLYFAAVLTFGSVGSGRRSCACARVPRRLAATAAG